MDDRKKSCENGIGEKVSNSTQATTALSVNAASSGNALTSFSYNNPIYDQDKFGDALIYLLKSLNSASGDGRRKVSFVY